MTEAEADRMNRLEEALHRVAFWAEAYPESAFPEPSLDRLAAASMRHVVTQIAHIARTALDQEARDAE
jgi:hypothetical protein